MTLGIATTGGPVGGTAGVGVTGGAGATGGAELVGLSPPPPPQPVTSKPTTTTTLLAVTFKWADILDTSRVIPLDYLKPRIPHIFFSFITKTSRAGVNFITFKFANCFLIVMAYFIHITLRQVTLLAPTTLKNGCKHERFNHQQKSLYLGSKISLIDCLISLYGR
jgi:hypothetical protein